MENKKVFCVTYGGGHVNIIKAMYPEIKKAKDLDVTILGLTLADDVLNKSKIPHKTISEYINILPYKNHIMEYGEMLYYGDDERVERIDTIAYYGIGYYDLIREHGEEKAKEMFAMDERKAFCPTFTMKKILEYENPDVVLLTTGVRFSEATGIAANMLGIPVVSVADLPRTTIKKPKFSKHYCVMNNFIKEELEINECKDFNINEIIATGQPVFEKNLKIEKNVKNKYSSEIKSDFDKLIIYLGQSEPEHIPCAIETVGILKEYADENKNIKIIIRPHPNAKKNYGYINTDNFIESKDGELKYLLSICDLAVTHYSTSGIEAVLLNKPVISVNFENKNNIIKGLDITYNIMNSNKLKAAIFKLLDYNSKESEELRSKRKNLENVENATTNILNVIRGIKV